MGRPSKLTEETQARICEGIRLGMTYARAAASVRIDYTTLRKWMIKGEASVSGQYREFFDAVKEAEADCTKACLAVIRRAALGDPAHAVVPQWTAAAWLLERRYPQEYGKVARILEPASDQKDQPEPGELINRVREIYGLPPREEGAEKVSGGNGTSH